MNVYQAVVGFFVEAGTAVFVFGVQEVAAVGELVVSVVRAFGGGG